MVDAQLVALPRDRAAKLAGITERQVDWWARTGVVVPAIDHRLTPHRAVRLYGFADLISLMVAADLRHRGVSLQAIRAIVNQLKARGFDRPLTELRFAVDGGEVLVQLDDGRWESAHWPGQFVADQVIELQPLVARVRTAASRDRESIGKIGRRRGMLGGKPVIAGTRVPVATVQRYLADGVGVAEILEAFPQLTRADVAVAARIAEAS